jgi:hypothetical protein
VISMLEFLIDNIFVSFRGILFQQVVGIPMGTNCAPLLADLFLYSCESEFLQKIAAHICKIYDFKIEVVPFIICFSTDLTTVVKFEVKVQKLCGRSGICGLFNFQLWRIYHYLPSGQLWIFTLKYP